MVTYIPTKGDIGWIEFDPQKGKEISKTRPALVISPKEYNHKAGLILCMPITSQVKNYPFEVLVRTNKIQGAILVDQIRGLDWRIRKFQKIEALPKTILEEALEKLKVLID